MVKFLGAPLEIPQAQTGVQAVRRQYVDDSDAALATRITTLESTSSSGSLGYNTKAKTANYTAANRDFVLANASGGSFVVTLPANPGVNAVIVVKKTDTSINTVSVQPSGGALIDGDPGATLNAPGSGATFVFDGTNWAVQSVVFFDSSVTTLNYRGDYSISTLYYANDVVSFGGNAFVAKVGNTGVNPGSDVSNATWALLVLHGAPATVTLGATSTGAAGSSASVSNSGTPGAAVFSFTIPAGAKGDLGTRGATWTSGTSTSPSTAGALTNDLYLNTSTNDLYQYNGTSFVVITNIKGAAGTNGTNGTNGTRGATWTSGTSTSPSTTGALTNDLYLNTSTYDVYQYNGTAWVVITNIKGAGYTFRGAWTSGTSYAVNDVFTYRGTSYVTVAATSTTTAPTTGTTTPFRAFATGLSFAGTWASGTAYNPGDVVAFAGSSYVNLSATAATAPTAGASSATWGLLAIKATDPAFTATATALATGSAPTAQLTGTYPNQVLAFGIPAGASGAAASIAPGTAASSVPGSTPKVTNSGTSSAATFNFEIPRGSTWSYGTTGPTAGTSYGVGDMFLRTDTQNLYQYDGSAWQLVANIKGAIGTSPTVTASGTTTAVPGTSAAVSQGGTATAVTLAFTIPRGSTWTTSTSVPAAGPTYGVGDMYLKTDTLTLYTYTGSAWTSLGSIKGTDGINGTNGSNAANPVFTASASAVAPTAPPTASVTGTYPNLNLGFAIPSATPTGGTTGQFYRKNTATNYDASWSYLSTPTFNTYSDMVAAITAPVVGTTAYTSDFGWQWSYAFNTVTGLYQWVPPGGSVICEAYQSAAQTVLDSTDVPITFGATAVNHTGPAGYSTYSTGNPPTNVSGGTSTSIVAWASGQATKIFAPYTGWYEVAGGAGFTANNTGSRIISVKRTGAAASIIGSATINNNNGSTIPTVFSTRPCVVWLVAGTDYVELIVRQSSGTASPGLSTYVVNQAYYPALTLVYRGLYSASS